MANACSRDVYQTGCRIAQGRAFVGCPCDSPVWVALYFTLSVLQFEFGRRSVPPTVLVFFVLQFVLQGIAKYHSFRPEKNA